MLEPGRRLITEPKGGHHERPPSGCEQLVACSAAVLLFTMMLPPSAAQLQTSPPVPTLNWLPCGDAFPGAQCAVAKVPLDYDHPGGATIGIALARIPAADRGVC